MTDARARGPWRRAALGLALIGMLLDPRAGATEVIRPPDFTIPKGEASPGDVTFSHARHAAKVEKCSTCHMKDFRMKRGGSGPVTLEAKQAGRFCGACHDGKTRRGGAEVFAIDECDRCHK